MPDIIGYQIFDSFDRPCSAMEPVRSDLWLQLNDLEREALEEDPDNPLTYAIGAVLDDGDITFDI